MEKIKLPCTEVQPEFPDINDFEQEHTDGILGKLVDVEMSIKNLWNRTESGTLLYSKIDAKANNGLGKITKVNTPISNVRPLLGEMAAVKHRNGKDWWVIVPEDSTKFTIFICCLYLSATPI